MASRDPCDSHDRGHDGVVHSDVQDYYGKILSSNTDLLTNACCTTSNRTGLTERMRTVLAQIHPEVSKK